MNNVPKIAKFQLAQLNIARAKDEMASSVMNGFVSRLDQINQLADESPGFVWRLQTDAGDATSIRVFDDPLLLVNMSVWESIEALRYFVYKSLHVELVRDRAAWFTTLGSVHQVLWWIPYGHIPSAQEAIQKLEHVRRNGATQDGFTFATSFSMPE